MGLTDLSLITYGLGNEIKPELIKPIANQGFIKPKGGLWASPVNSAYSWKHWCDDESFGDTTSSFTFQYRGNVLKINTLLDLEGIPWEEDAFGAYHPDFVSMVQSNIDAIWLTIAGEHETRHSYPKCLYGWDCECVLIMNPFKIV